MKEPVKLRVNIFSYEKVETCGGFRYRRKLSGRQHVVKLGKKRKKSD